jgi:hypothetical protein
MRPKMQAIYKQTQLDGIKLIWRRCDPANGRIRSTSISIGDRGIQCLADNLGSGEQNPAGAGLEPLVPARAPLTPTGLGRLSCA